MSLFFSTCSLINSSLHVITGLKQVNSKFALILQPHKGLRISDKDRRRIVSVHRRLECLIEPLNFCILWVRDRDSCILTTLQYGSDLVQSVLDFLDKVKFTTDDLDPFTRVLDEESSNKVDYFLRELDFACNSVSLAVSIAKALSSNPVSPSSQLSPAALLKASMRISEMANRSGDLCALSGTLYQRSEHSDWTETSTDATIRISQFNALDPNDCPYLIRVSWSSNSVNFPVQTALSLRVCTCKEIGVTNHSALDTLVLTWTYKSAPGRLLHRNPSGAMESSELSMDSSDEDTLVVRGATEVPKTLRARISSTHISGGSATGDEYAFVYNTVAAALSPLDVVYMARLCVLESMRRFQPSQTDACIVSSPRPAAQNSVHLEASDETLIALLVDARFDPSSVERTQLSPEIDLVVSEH